MLLYVIIHVMSTVHMSSRLQHNLAFLIFTIVYSLMKLTWDLLTSELAIFIFQSN